MSNRRRFIKNALLGATSLTFPTYLSYGAHPLGRKEANDPKISLAQWSLHRSLQKGDIQAEDFAQIAKNDYNISAIEYVNQFYVEQATNQKFWGQMKARADDLGVKSLLIMVDDEGELGNTSEPLRKNAVKNHYKWIHAAKILGCHSIRVNAFGQGSKDVLYDPLVDGLGELAAYGAQQQINILIENHGMHTSDGAYMTGIIKEVDNPYLGTLPDFGNWCLNAEWGSTKNNQCTQIYPHEKGVADFLPFAKGVSAKSYNFDKDGNETYLDYPKLLGLVKAANFDGFIGIEYEGDQLSEAEGIKATKKHIEQVWKSL